MQITEEVIRELVRQTLGTGRHVGVVVGVIRDADRQIFTHGAASGADPPIFAIGSVTKVFTTALLGEMVRRGLVGLDDPVRKHLPDAVCVPARNGKEITLLHLAMHTSGLPSLPDDFDRKVKDPHNPYADIVTQDIYDFLSRYKLKRDPGGKYEYSNLGMGVLGHALSRRCGTALEEALRAHVLKPLGMDETAILLPPDRMKRLVGGHHPNGSPAVHWDIPEIFAAAGALKSGAADMMKFLAANLDLSRTGLEEVFASCQRSRLYAGEGVEIGLGWHISPLMNSSHKGVFHDGATYAHSSFVGFVRDRRVGVFVLANVGPGEQGGGCSLLGLMLLSALAQ